MVSSEDAQQLSMLPTAQAAAFIARLRGLQKNEVVLTSYGTAEYPADIPYEQVQKKVSQAQFTRGYLLGQTYSYALHNNVHGIPAESLPETRSAPVGMASESEAAEAALTQLRHLMPHSVAVLRAPKAEHLKGVELCTAHDHHKTYMDRLQANATTSSTSSDGQAISTETVDDAVSSALAPSDGHSSSSSSSSMYLQEYVSPLSSPASADTTCNSRPRRQADHMPHTGYPCSSIPTAPGQLSTQILQPPISPFATHVIPRKNRRRNSTSARSNLQPPDSIESRPFPDHFASSASMLKPDIATNTTNALLEPSPQVIGQGYDSPSTTSNNMLHDEVADAFRHNSSASYLGNNVGAMEASSASCSPVSDGSACLNGPAVRSQDCAMHDVQHTTNSEGGTPQSGGGLQQPDCGVQRGQCAEDRLSISQESNIAAEAGVTTSSSESQMQEVSDVGTRMCMDVDGLQYVATSGQLASVDWGGRVEGENADVCSRCGGYVLMSGHDSGHMGDTQGAGLGHSDAGGGTAANGQVDEGTMAVGAAAGIVGNAAWCSCPSDDDEGMPGGGEVDGGEKSRICAPVDMSAAVGLGGCPDGGDAVVVMADNELFVQTPDTQMLILDKGTQGEVIQRGVSHFLAEEFYECANSDGDSPRLSSVAPSSSLGWINDDGEYQDYLDFSSHHSSGFLTAQNSTDSSSPMHTTASVWEAGGEGGERSGSGDAHARQLRAALLGAREAQRLRRHRLRMNSAGSSADGAGGSPGGHVTRGVHAEAHVTADREPRRGLGDGEGGRESASQGQSRSSHYSDCSGGSQDGQLHGGPRNAEHSAGPSQDVAHSKNEYCSVWCGELQRPVSRGKMRLDGTEAATAVTSPAAGSPPDGMASDPGAANHKGVGEGLLGHGHNHDHEQPAERPPSRHPSQSSSSSITCGDVPELPPPLPAISHVRAAAPTSTSPHGTHVSAPSPETPYLSPSCACDTPTSLCALQTGPPLPQDVSPPPSADSSHSSPMAHSLRRLSISAAAEMSGIHTPSSPLRWSSQAQTTGTPPAQLPGSFPASSPCQISPFMNMFTSPRATSEVHADSALADLQAALQAPEPAGATAAAVSVDQKEDSDSPRPPTNTVATEQPQASPHTGTDASEPLVLSRVPATRLPTLVMDQPSDAAGTQLPVLAAGSSRHLTFASGTAQQSGQAAATADIQRSVEVEEGFGNPFSTPFSTAQLAAELGSQFGELGSQLGTHLDDLRSQIGAQIGELGSQIGTQIGELGTQIGTQLGTQFSADNAAASIAAVTDSLASSLAAAGDVLLEGLQQAAEMDTTDASFDASGQLMVSMRSSNHSRAVSLDATGAPAGRRPSHRGRPASADASSGAPVRREDSQTALTERTPSTRLLKEWLSGDLCSVDAAWYGGAPLMEHDDDVDVARRADSVLPSVGRPSLDGAADQEASPGTGGGRQAVERKLSGFLGALWGQVGGEAKGGDGIGSRGDGEGEGGAGGSMPAGGEASGQRGDAEMDDGEQGKAEGGGGAPSFASKGDVGRRSFKLFDWLRGK